MKETSNNENELVDYIISLEKAALDKWFQGYAD